MMKRAKLGEIWVQMGKITSEQLAAALADQQGTSRRLGEILLERKQISEHDIAEARAFQLDVPYCDIASTVVDPQAVALVPAQIARTYTLLPIGVQGDRLHIAITDPNDVEVLDLLQRLTRLRPEPRFAEERALQKAIDEHYGSPSTASDDTFASALDDITVERIEDEVNDINDLINASGQAPVIKMVNLLLTEAVRARASDIHLEPRRNNVDVRFRVDGVLRRARVLPRSFLAPCVSRLKIMAELDIAEKRLPQDGRISLVLDGRHLDLRVSTLPIHYGERVVMRVLDKSASIRPLEQLNMSAPNLKRFDDLIRRPFGIILVTGPTGSGKTTTLYSALNALKDETTNIITCEDPIEYDLDEINQSAVNERAGLTFARQLRSILRQDPDVVLVGEIRDTDTAEIAFRAAMTGHLVLSTLHANDAATTVTRLLDMNVPPFLIASGLIGIVAQRLVRRLCPACRHQAPPSVTEAALLGLDPSEPVWHPGGCSACADKGYAGRIGVHEVMTCNEDFSRLIMAQSPGSQLRAGAIASGMIPLLDDVVEKVRTGFTSVDEAVRRVCVKME